MKLVIAMVQDDDALDVVDAITEEGFRVTKLATTGGFLKSGNTTLLIGVEADKVDEVIGVVEEVCKKRKQIVTTASPIAGNLDMYMSYPVEVELGGATIFVVDVDKFVKI